MASSNAYLQYLLGQLSELEEITYRPMMGEYIIYYRGKIVGGIYDDRLLVKPVKTAISYMPSATYELPYEGAKEMLKIKFSFILVHFNIILYHCTFRVMIFERSMILCLVVYNFVLVERNLLLFVIPYIIIIYSLRKEVDIMNYISVKAASEKWGISERRIQKLCEENRIDGTEKFGRAWMIPKDAEKPVDGRMKTRNKQEENHGI